MKLAQDLASSIEWYKEVIKELKNPESRVQISLYVGCTNLGCDAEIKKVIRKIYNRKLTALEAEFAKL